MQQEQAHLAILHLPANPTPENPCFARCQTPPTPAYPYYAHHHHHRRRRKPHTRTNGERNHAAASAPNRAGGLVLVPPFLRILIANLCVGRAPGDPYCHQGPAVPLRVRRPESLQLAAAQGPQPERQVLALPRHHRRRHRRIRRACPRANRNAYPPAQEDGPARRPAQVDAHLQPRRCHRRLRARRARRRQGHAVRQPGQGLRLHAPLGRRPAAGRAGAPRQPVRRDDQGLHQERPHRAHGGDGAAARERHDGHRRPLGPRRDPRQEGQVPHRRLPAQDGPGRQVRGDGLPRPRRALLRLPRGRDGAPPARPRQDQRPRRRQRRQHPQALPHLHRDQHARRRRLREAGQGHQDRRHPRPRGGPQGHPEADRGPPGPPILSRPEVTSLSSFASTKRPAAFPA